MSAASGPWPTVGKVEKKEDRGCPLVATEPGHWPEGSVSHRLGPAADSHPDIMSSQVRLSLSNAQAMIVQTQFL